MNWNHIASAYPEVYRLIGSDSVENLYGFFDSYELFVLPTCELEATRPWGYELHSPQGRFVRQQCHYRNRTRAMAAGFEQACAELDRLLNAGNA